MEIRVKVWPLVVSLVVCSLIMAFFTYGIARQEFNYAVWIWNMRQRYPSDYLQYLPPITYYLKSIYPQAWALPVLTGGVAGLVMFRKITNATVISFLLGFLATLHVLWFFFWVAGLYVVNQSFYS